MEHKSVKQVAPEIKIISKTEFDRILDPRREVEKYRKDMLME